MARRKRSSPSLLARLRSDALPALWSRARQWTSTLGWLVALAALGAGAAYGIPRLQAAVAAAEPAREIAVEFTDPPAWAQAELLPMLDETVLRQLTADPFRREDLVAARNALAGSGWFDEVAQVRRVRSDLVRVDARFVSPAAVVRDGDGDHLVDSNARLLPRSYPHGGAAEQIVVTGAHFARPTRPGARWDGADVAAALRLLDLIEDRPWRAQVRSIDASRALSDETLVIVTDLGARIVWGSAPGEETPLEVSAEAKLAYLDKAFEEFARIDTGYDGELRFYDRGYFAE